MWLDHHTKVGSDQLLCTSAEREELDTSGELTRFWDHELIIQSIWHGPGRGGER